MTDEQHPQARPRVLRPWEAGEPDEGSAGQYNEASEEAPEEAPDETREEPEEHRVDDDERLDKDRHEGDVADLGRGPTSLDGFTDDDYQAATTREYQGLAEEVAKAAAEDVEQQAVAASVAGVGSGLIGFDDVTGKRGMTEEEVELEEQQRASDLTMRVVTAIVLVGIFIGSLMLGREWFTGFVSVVMLVSLGEFYSATRTRGFAPIALFGFLGVLGVTIGTLTSGVAAIGVTLAIVSALVGLFMAATGRRNPLENSAVTVMGIAWIGLLGFAIGIIRGENYVGKILLVVLVTAAFDAGSYFAGRAVGRRPMAPKVSPKKTWEGYVGGLVTAVLLAAVLSTFKDIFPVTLMQGAVLAGGVAILAPLGDAAESVVKRSLDVKDMSSLLPGHGGMLDRIDALLFVVPGAFLFFGVFGLS